MVESKVTQDRAWGTSEFAVFSPFSTAVSLMACECWKIVSSDHSVQLRLARAWSAGHSDGLPAGLFFPGL